MRPMRKHNIDMHHKLKSCNFLFDKWIVRQQLSSFQHSSTRQTSCSVTDYFASTLSTNVIFLCIRTFKFFCVHFILFYVPNGCFLPKSFFVFIHFLQKFVILL